MRFAGKHQVLVPAPQPVDLIVDAIGLVPAREEADFESIRVRAETEALVGVGVTVAADLHDAGNADLPLMPLQPPGLLRGRHHVL